MTARPRHYLVVDDDSTNNLICEFMIRKIDKEAKIVSYLIPEEALSYIENNYSGKESPLPTILFLDVNMPTMTGFEFLDEFKKFKKELKYHFIIYILSSSIEDYKTQAMQYPFVAGFLSKPLNLSQLEKIRQSSQLSGK